MSKHKLLVLALKACLLSISLCLAYLLIRPIVDYSTLRPEPLYTYILDSKRVSSDSYKWLRAHYKWEKTPSLQKSDLIWIDDPSALTTDFGNLLDHNLIVGEYLGASENITKTQREQIEYFFDVQFTKRIGKVCSDLADPFEVPESARLLYEKNSHMEWNFYGKGIIFFTESNLIVLQEGVDYQGEFYWRNHQLTIPFRGYFEVIKTNQMVTSTFHTNFTETGLKKLTQMGITDNFPASVQVTHPLYKGLYLTSALKNTSVNVPFFYHRIENLMVHKGLYERATTEELYWKWYIPQVKKLEIEARTLRQNRNTTVATAPQLTEPRFVVKGQQVLKREADGKYKPFFMKGVNLGAALPGKTFTEFPNDVSVYRLWLNQMGLLHINTLRVYTLLPPAFYKALYDYNQTAENPIYLLQEIWPEENPADHNYLAQAYNQTYQQEIAFAVNAIHGNTNIPKRSYRAYGAYAYDVSPYLIGYLVGRELEPDEVLATNRLNPTYHFEGEYLYGELGASPTENWLAASCDYALQIETKKYGSQALVSVVNWPTLDPLEHFSEWNIYGDKSKQYNDKAVVDINHIGIHKDRMPGLFGSYHIYPNYPDFMNNDPEYNLYADEQGRFRYGGYLKAFMSLHSKYPALVAEYGISTSMTTAHIAPDGNHHGGISESEQVPEIIRMAKAIEREGYMGGLVFEWMDEWAKKTWITEPYMIPYNRHALWHNVMDPEQNYGILAMNAVPATNKRLYSRVGESLESVEVSNNASFVTLLLTFKNEQVASNPTDILINTYTPTDGTAAWEFKLQLRDQSKLLVNPNYNWVKNRFESKKIPTNLFEEMILQTNGEGLLKNGVKIPPISHSLSNLKTGAFEDLQTQIERRGTTVTIRLPYTLLGISDPSSRQALSDPALYSTVGTDQIKTITTPRLHFEILTEDDVPFDVFLDWRAWDEVEYYSRPKQGFEMLSRYFESLD